MKIKKVMKEELLFIKSFKLAKSNLNKTGLIVLFDALFFISFVYILPILNLYINQNITPPETFSSNFILTAFILIIMLLKLIYYLIILFVYSFFKYSILDFIKSLFSKTKFSFNRLGQFYVLNIIIAGIFFAIMLLLSFILENVKLSYRPFVFIFMAIPFLLFLYVVINVSHSLFYQGSSMKDSIKNGFKITFAKIRIYRETILIIILAALLLWLLFLGSGYLIRFIANKNYNLYLSAYAYFKQSSIIVFDIVFYLVILINRISFYAIIRENK